MLVEELEFNGSCKSSGVDLQASLDPGCSSTVIRILPSRLQFPLQATSIAILTERECLFPIALQALIGLTWFTYPFLNQSV